MQQPAKPAGPRFTAFLNSSASLMSRFKQVGGPKVAPVDEAPRPQDTRISKDTFKWEGLEDATDSDYDSISNNEGDEDVLDLEDLQVFEPDSLPPLPSSTQHRWDGRSSSNSGLDSQRTSAGSRSRAFSASSWGTGSTRNSDTGFMESTPETLQIIIPQVPPLPCATTLYPSDTAPPRVAKPLQVPRLNLALMPTRHDSADNSPVKAHPAIVGSRQAPDASTTPALQEPLSPDVASVEAEMAALAAGPAHRHWYPKREGRFHVFPPVPAEEMGRMHAFLSQLPLEHAREAARIWQQLLEARYAAESMATRSVRIVKDMAAAVKSSQVAHGEAIVECRQMEDAMRQQVHYYQQMLNRVQESRQSSQPGSASSHQANSADQPPSPLQQQQQQQHSFQAAQAQWQAAELQQTVFMMQEEVTGLHQVNGHLEADLRNCQKLLEQAYHGQKQAAQETSQVRQHSQVLRDAYTSLQQRYGAVAQERDLLAEEVARLRSLLAKGV